MTLEQQVLDRFRTLPPASQQEVLNFVEFLATRQSTATIDEDESPDNFLVPTESLRQAWQDAREGRTTPIREIIDRLKAEQPR
jgi:Protein of unknown function (DUF2281)